MRRQCCYIKMVVLWHKDRMMITIMSWRLKDVYQEDPLPPLLFMMVMIPNINFGRIYHLRDTSLKLVKWKWFEVDITMVRLRCLPRGLSPSVPHDTALENSSPHPPVRSWYVGQDHNIGKRYEEGMLNIFTGRHVDIDEENMLCKFFYCTPTLEVTNMGS